MPSDFSRSRNAPPPEEPPHRGFLSSRTAAWVTFIATAIAIPMALIALYDRWNPNSPASSSPPTSSSGPEIALEDKFQLSPISYGENLSVTVKKVRTADKGRLAVYACKGAAEQALIGETAYAAAPDDFLMNGLFSGTSVVLLMNIFPEDGDAATVLAPWDLAGLKRTAPPTSRPGTLTCRDVAGLF